MSRSGTFLAAVLLMTGCAAQTPRRYASSTCATPVNSVSAQVCKHCNCIMPADTDWNAPCTVCNCGYHGDQCLRGGTLKK